MPSQPHMMAGKSLESVPKPVALKIRSGYRRSAVAIFLDPTCHHVYCFSRHVFPQKPAIRTASIGLIVPGYTRNGIFLHRKRVPFTQKREMRGTSMVRWSQTFVNIVFPIEAIETSNISNYYSLIPILTTNMSSTFIPGPVATKPAISLPSDPARGAAIIFLHGLGDDSGPWESMLPLLHIRDVEGWKLWVYSIASS